MNLNEKNITIDAIIKREKLEQEALACFTSDTLKHLNVSIENLPQRCQKLLRETAESQSSLGIEQLDSAAISLYSSKEISSKLEDDYEILKLKQNNVKLQMKIDRNKKFLEELRMELEYSRKCLMSQKLNPDNINNYIRQINQKIISYEDSYEKAKTKYEELSVPKALMPTNLCARESFLHELHEEAMVLKQRADDVTLVREARDVFNRLRK